MPCHAGWSSPGRTRLPCALQPVCKRHTHTVPPSLVGTAGGDAALLATSRDPALLVGYLEAYFDRPKLWLRDWRIAINVSKSTGVLLAKAARRVRQPRPVQFLGEPIEWVETARYLGGDPRYAANMVGTSQPCEKEGSWRTGRAWPTP
jgi:hypothetical protein